MYWQDFALLVIGAVGGRALVRYFAYKTGGDVLWFAASVVMAFVVLNLINTPAITVLSYISGKCVGIFGTGLGMYARARHEARQANQP